MSQYKSSRDQRVFKGPDLLGGLNDTDTPETRGENEYKVVENWDYKLPGSLVKCKGRLLINDDLGSKITSIITPPVNMPLLEVTAANCNLYFKYGTGASPYFTASIALGKYYYHATLAASLQTALNAAIAGAPFTVTFSSSTGYTIVSSVSAIIMCWLHTNTTLPKELFGFSCSAHGTGHSVTSDMPCPKPYPYNRFVTTADGKLYRLSTADGSPTELKYPDGTAIDASALPWSGRFQSNRWYGSNGKASLVLRDNTRIYKMLDNKGVALYEPAKFSTPTQYYNYTAAHVVVATLTPALPYCRLLLPMTNLPSLSNTGINNTILYLGNSASTMPGFTTEIYYEVPSLGIKKLIKTISSTDIDANGPIYNFSDKWLMGYVNGANSYLLIKYIPLDSNSASLTIGGNTSIPSGAAAIFTMDANGEMGITTSSWYGVVSIAKVTDGLTPKWNYRASLLNEEGFETELSDPLPFSPTAFSSQVVRIYYSLLSECVNQDYVYLRIYRTADEGTVYYRLIDIPVALLTANLYLVCATLDADLATDIQADLLTTRSAPPPFTMSCWWEGRIWFAGVADTPWVLYYCDLDAQGNPIPESVNLDTNYIPIGQDQSPITGLCPLDDRLLVFKEFGAETIMPSGAGFAKPETGAQKIMGTLSHQSIQGVRTDQGSGYFWHGSDGHFYYSDGVTVTNLSQGRLETLVGG